ncbi:FecR family protein [Xanthobacter autotrophicus]|uniref:FecR family protein n=1 Tax=Xanthobacter autotrophicus TaxID=280 RepID=UPI0024A754E8|nr:FecR family protein [Xanthobacter autotrophicus]MDI4656315.1 FecR family protein [Xanthobacter autotrophicus]
MADPNAAAVVLGSSASRLVRPFSRRGLLSLAALALACGRGAAADRAGIVEALAGEGGAERGGARLPLATGDAVFVGDMVVTGETARLAMRLGAATQVRLGGRTRLRIDRFLVDRGGVFTLGNGAMLYDRPDGAPGRDVEVETPYGRLAVRGTRFFAGPSQERFGVFVMRGRVRVSAGDATVDLGPGQGTDVAAIGGAPSPVRAWSEARIRAALALVE